MILSGVRKLQKLKLKNRGNQKLSKSIDELISILKTNNWSNGKELKAARIDADCVHNDGFYFFNINVHRTMIMIAFEDNEADVIWVGTHQEYEATFKNNKMAIKNWLKRNNLI